MSLLNLPKSTIGQVKEKLLRYYKKAIEQGKDMRSLRSVCLWSTPGIGKSQMAKQIVEELSDWFQMEMEFREIRLSDCTIFELLGLMHLEPGGKEVQYVEPPIYKTEDPRKYIIYLVDELDKASVQLQAAALHLILDHRFWMYELPQNSIVIAAGNPENIDGELFSKFKPELNNRFRHYLIEADFSCWESWAKEQGVHPLVLNFLASRNDYLYGKDAGEEQAVFATPRSWAAVSDYLNLMAEEEIDWDDLYEDICGDVGTDAALAFKTYCTTTGILPKTEDIFLGKIATIPKSPDARYVVSNSMVTYIWEHRNQIAFGTWQNEWKHACTYINLFPVDYAAAFYKNVLALEIDKIGLLATPEFQFWKRKYGKYL